MEKDMSNINKFPKGQMSEFQRDNRVGASNAAANRKTGAQVEGTAVMQGAMMGKDGNTSIKKN